MKKTLMALAAMAVMVATAADTGTESYLYWMIDTEDASTGTFTYDSVRVRAYETASPNIYSESTYLTLYYGSDIEAGISVPDEYATMGLPFYAALADMAGSQYSYVVELFNDSTKVAYSDSIVFTDAMASGFVASVTPSGTIPATPWVTGNFKAVPEPNSALLLLIGCAALGLRRKRTGVIA